MLPDFSDCYWGWLPPRLELPQFLQPNAVSPNNSASIDHKGLHQVTVSVAKKEWRNEGENPN